jgi:hypothetical protein
LVVSLKSEATPSTTKTKPSGKKNALKKENTSAFNIQTDTINHASPQTLKLIE